MANRDLTKIIEGINNICVNDSTNLSLEDYRQLIYILTREIKSLEMVFNNRLLHIIEVTKERDFSECRDLNISWHCVSREIFITLLISGLPSNYSIPVELLNMSDEELAKNKNLCEYIR